MRRFLFDRLDARTVDAMGVHKAGRIIGDTAVRGPALLAMLVAIVITVIYASDAAGQSTTRLRGFVYDGDNGSPVVGSEVAIDGTSYRALTDGLGKFSFDHVPPGTYALTAMASGYERSAAEQVDVVVDVPRHVVIALQKKVYEVAGIRVEGRRITPRLGSVTTIDKQQITAMHPRDISDVLEKVPGVYIQRTGMVGGQAEVRIRGSASKHVLVLVDGQKINLLSSGVADLATVPVELVERIEVHKGGASAEFGPDAFGGVINIITQQEALGAAHQEPTSYEGAADWGRWKTQGANITSVNPVRFENIATKFAFSRKESEGDFDYSYSYAEAPMNKTHTGTRMNNRFMSSSYFASGSWTPKSGTSLRYSAQIYESRNGLPGMARRQNAHACKEDDRALVGVSLEHALKSDLLLGARFGFSRFEQYFWDLKARTVNQYETRFTGTGLQARMTLAREVWRGNRLEFGVELWRDALDHVDCLHKTYSMGETVRETSSAFVLDDQAIDLSRTAILDEMTIDIALRYDKSTTTPDDTPPRFPWEQPRAISRVERWSPKVGLTASKGNRLRVVVRGSHGKSFRLPSMNALFWKGDVRARGNPDLSPEYSRHTDGGVEIVGKGKWYAVSSGVTFYHNRVTDMIVWVQAYQGVWTPVNRESARVTGHEDFFAVSLFDGLVDISYENSITNALNKVPGHNSYDKVLTFTPHYITNLTVRFDCRSLFLSYAVRWVDKRYALEGNEKSYHSYRIDDMGVGLRMEICQHWRVGVDWRLYNVGDEDYELITHYPMPGRHHSLGLRVSYGLEDGEK